MGTFGIQGKGQWSILGGISEFSKISDIILAVPPGYLSGNLFHKPDLIVLNQQLIHIGFKLGIQNIYTLPLSGSQLCGVNWDRMENFVLIFAEKWVFYTLNGGQIGYKMVKFESKVTEKGPKWIFFMIMMGN